MLWFKLLGLSSQQVKSRGGARKGKEQQLADLSSLRLKFASWHLIGDSRQGLSHFFWKSTNLSNVLVNQKWLHTSFTWPADFLSHRAYYYSILSDMSIEWLYHTNHWINHLLRQNRTHLWPFTFEFEHSYSKSLQYSFLIVPVYSILGHFSSFCKESALHT